MAAESNYNNLRLNRQYLGLPSGPFVVREVVVERKEEGDYLQLKSIKKHTKLLQHTKLLYSNELAQSLKNLSNYEIVREFCTVTRYY